VVAVNIGMRQDRNWFPTNQRIVVLTFDSPEEAEAWDAAGQPVTVLTVLEEVT